MNSYLYRDTRRRRLADALDFLAVLEPTGAQLMLRSVIEIEQAALAADDWRVTDRTYLAVAVDWAWRNFMSIKELVDHDLVREASIFPAALTEAHGLAILNASLPHSPAGPPADYLDRVRAACEADQDETAFTELVHTAHSHWLNTGGEEPAYPFDDVGVLLPLRLETLFDEPATRFNDSPTQWKLSLRVTPDEASICRDNAHVSEGEAKALTAFWEAVKQPGDLHESWLDGDDAGIAWQQLADRVTPGRAAWLVSTVVPQLDGDAVMLVLPADMPAAPQPNRVGGMPPELRVFAVTGVAIDGLTHHPVGRLPMAEDQQIDPAQLALPLPGGLDEEAIADPAQLLAKEQKRWWVSWEAAKAVGLGGEWLLPAGMTPQNIDALYVVGIGDETPDAHFKTQVDAGELGVLRLGAPTNTVRGAAAADLGQNLTDWRKVAQARLGQRLDPQLPPAMDAGRGLQQHLTGAALPFFPGADLADETVESHRMVQALWPALWGYWLRDLWQVGDDAFRAGFWAFEHLYPEGPLMPLRIGDQPYGLLPVTALGQWEASESRDAEGAAQRQVEMAMTRTLNELRGQWAGAVRPTRSVVGKSTGEFVELLGQDALSRGYIARQFTPAWAQIAPYRLDPAQQQEFVERAVRAHRTASKLMERDPIVPYLANGFWRRSILPLVQPTQMIYRHQNGERRERLALTRFLSLLFEFALAEPPENYDLAEIFQRWWVLDDHGEHQLRVLPDSLLMRLLIYACQTAFGWRRAPSGSPPERRVLRVQQKMALELADMLDQAAWQDVVIDEQTGEPAAFVLRIPAERRSQLERALRATLDSAANRIDPWITGFAWQRLKQHSSSPRRSHRLGAYGWVDGPFIGQPGPTDAGRLHTPSYNQTLAALILRDKFLSSGRAGAANDDGRNPWEMNITASRARLAEEIADEVRLGFHIYEIVGRHVENILGVHQTVKELRTSDRYAMRPERKDPHEVCNGIEALKGLLAGDAAFPLSPDQRAALELLHAALDTYGDLLMADGVLQLVNRQVDRAAEAMEAAAGFSRPPSFEFIRTPPSGYQLESLVVSALPFVSVDDLGADASPVRLADPSVAAFVDSKLAGGWVWQARNLDDDTVLGMVDLATLGLAPIDTLALSDDLLREWARRTLGLPLAFINEERNRAWLANDAQGNPLGMATLVTLSLTPTALAALDDAALHSLVRAALGAADDALVEETPPADPRLWVVRDENGGLLGLADLDRLGLTPAEVDALAPADLQRRVRQAVGAPLVEIRPPRQHQLAQQLVAALGSRPAAGRDFTADKALQAAADAAIYGELRRRYERLFAAGQQLLADLRAAADDAARAAALRRALTWSVAPISEPADRKALFAALLGTALPEQATPLAELAEAVAVTLEARLNAAPSPASLAPDEQIGAPLVDQQERKRLGAPDGVPTLARALANLASPQGKLAILAGWPQDALIQTTNLTIAQPEPALDEEWLTVVAATRASLARLEALQLEMDLPLDAWSSSPGDPWQRTPIQGNLASRDATSPLGLQMPRFVAAYGSADAWLGQQVAVGLIDGFGEAIPMPQRSTLTAFGFNAPAARAPQAILLAVPPRARQRLDSDLLWQIVAETRELAHARTARIEDLGDLQALTPTMWLQSSGPTRVRLEAWPLFD